MNQIAKRAIVSLSMLALVASSIGEASARIGSSGSSRSSGSFSSSRSTYSAPSRSSSSRIGGGSSIGMTRSSTMEKARSQPAPSQQAAARPQPSPTYSSASPSTTPSQAPAQTANPTNKRNWVAPVVAGAAGAVAGYALGKANSNPPPAQYGAPGYQPGYNQPGYSDQGYANSGVTAPAQVYAPHAAPVGAMSSNSGGFGFGFLLILLALAGLGYFAYRKLNAQTAGASGRGGFSYGAAQPATAATPAIDERCRDLVEGAKTFFLELQELNNRGDLAELKRRTTADVYGSLENDIRSRASASQTNVVSVYCALVECVQESDQLVASIRYEALIAENPNDTPEQVNEVWHFVKASGSTQWKLAGIEQL